MPRGPRLAFDNSIYHIINRGNFDQKIFRSHGDYEKFLFLLAKYKLKFNFKIYNFCLMPNHFHLLSKFRKAQDLSKSMQGINLSYTLYYHGKYSTYGYLWRGRFKNMLIEKDKYLLECGAYIDSNPMIAGFVENSSHWKWSSCNFYFSGKNTYINVDKDVQVRLIDENPAFRSLGQYNKRRKDNYREYVMNRKREKFNFIDE